MDYFWSYVMTQLNSSFGVRFCLMVKKGYRDPPYHNWMHAFSVTHFCYLLYKNLGLSNYLEYVYVTLCF